jgi:uncharacterized spore protein YtfJ
MFDAQDLLSRIGEHAHVNRVFGEPIVRDDVTIVPVAVVAGVGGEGSGPEENGQGYGFGVTSRAIGAFSIRKEQVRFVPALDLRTLVLTGLAAFALVTRAVHGKRRRR